ncbi:hypothetical protein [Pseudomonas sp. 24 E 13]|uniref:hypothetical protein n=1 Tax=Pseudomonas sp. 24 E 13 TaxID=1844095 RepID=UPI0008125E00|nr:hypothetical protein [Pseudomonas sp. 24 E 13]CRM74275.1 hypothetical protein [Pseudomonas sp. 24 E 13]
MEDIAKALADWKADLCYEIDVGGLFSRNKLVHKWKAPWRSLLLRESVAWRLQDLLAQSYHLHNSSHSLGARILLRSAFETIAVLIHLNRSMRQVVAGNMSFHEFSDHSTKLLMGSRDDSTPHKSINILTILEKADKRYPGIFKWYSALSESAHPNYEGMLFGYSEKSDQSQVTIFSNRWIALYGNSHLDAIRACIDVFYSEYNVESPSAFECLEHWIENNDSKLEATKPLEKSKTQTSKPNQPN